MSAIVAKVISHGSTFSQLLRVGFESKRLQADP